MEKKRALKIIYVEDNSTYQNMVKNSGNFYSHEIIQAYNGKEFIRKFDTESDFDLIVLDITMPNFGGLLCMEYIRKSKDEKKKKLPVIAMTGNNKNYNSGEFKEFSFLDYIEKPCTGEDLFRLIRQYFPDAY